MSRLSSLEAPLATTVPARKRKRRPLLWLTLLVLVVAVSLWFYLRQDATPAVQYQTAEVTLGDLEKTVTALGTLKPKGSTVDNVGVPVGAQVSGLLKKLHVQIGDRVQKGQLLAEIDATVYATQVAIDRANLANLKAQLRQQQAQLTYDRQQLARNRSLAGTRALSKSELQGSETAVAVGQARIDALQAQIDGAQAQLEGNQAKLGYTRIYAPSSGVVVAEPAAEGQVLNANQSAPELLTIANLDTMTVWAQVAEADIARIRLGMPAYFTTLGEPDKRWHGQVNQILPAPEIVNNVVLYDVLIDIDNPEHRLMSNMTAQVFFVLGQVKDKPLVPVAALRPGRDGADSAELSVMTPRGPQQRQVRVLLQNRVSAAIASGVSAGDRVVTGVQNGPADSPRRRGLGMF